MDSVLLELSIYHLTNSNPCFCCSDDLIIVKVQGLGVGDDIYIHNGFEIIGQDYCLVLRSAQPNWLNMFSTLWIPAWEPGYVIPANYKNAKIKFYHDFYYNMHNVCMPTSDFEDDTALFDLISSITCIPVDSDCDHEVADLDDDDQLYHHILDTAQELCTTDGEFLSFSNLLMRIKQGQ